MKTTSLSHIIEDTSLPAELVKIAEKIINSERISVEEGVLLFERAELGFLGALGGEMLLRG